MDQEAITAGLRKGQWEGEGKLGSADGGAHNREIIIMYSSSTEE